ncbi:putative LPS assembly protein LptD [Dysgonomonas sp. HGC4]|uniref:putative LPS assembly protein LptD n=1 Tax=Dysgonomonas sp. HGC4 TaxID=1658009 RepID=UPI00068024AC|nr:putative LPS assembly protein LptD [Dysgonomonas sp. HGC4]MBD8349219.1 LPS-assembly protein LptD [Dysgonomonas sp. HGC4]
MKKTHFCIYTFLFVLFSSPFWGAQLHKQAESNSNISFLQDSVTSDRALTTDSLRPQVSDSIAQDTTKSKKTSLDAPVDYSANDSIVFTSDSRGFLYGDSKVNYQTMGIQAENIAMNMDSSIVHATYGLDSIGEEFGRPVFTDNGTEYEMKSVSYNFKTKKGYMTTIITQQGEGYIVADKAKKNADDTFFMCDGKYTTCDNHDHPHFYMMLTKAKVRPKKDVITGPAYLVIEGLPLPLALPFGFFPFSEKYSSGIIMPSYGDDMDRGFNLRDGGYYFAINDNIDLALTGEIYTKGSWGLSARSSYKKRYKYSGSFNVNYLYTKRGDRDIPNTFSESKDMSIDWQHSQDPKANMFRTLAASVNYRSSSYNQNSLNVAFTPSGTENTRSSTVSLTQRFPNSPFTLTANATANQVLSDSSIMLTLPNVTVTMSRIFPFKRKEAVGSAKWYEKISLNYTGDLRNSIKTKENMLFRSNLVKDWRNAMQHRVQTAGTFSVLNYLNITPSFSYNERWYTRSISQKWDPVQNAHVAADTTFSFFRSYDFNYNVSFQTRLYGFYEPLLKIGKLQKIRHVFTPSISFGGNPDFTDPRFGSYKKYSYYDANGELQTHLYSPFSQEIFTPSSARQQGNINFSFENNIEMKVGTDNDSTKIISLIDNLGVNFSYNMMADEFKWSDIGTNMRLKLSKSLTVNLNAVWDPYMYNEKGQKIDRLLIGNGGIARLVSTGYTISPSINQDTFKKWFGKGGDSTSKDDKNRDNPEADLSDEDGDVPEDDGPRKSLFDKKEAAGEFDQDGFLKNDIKWNLSINYNMSYNSKFDQERERFKGVITHNLGFNGSIQPTKNWNLSFNASYDVPNSRISWLTCNLSRNLHCWNITASFNPIGPYATYYISLRVNSSMLQDLKYEQRGRATSYDPVWN